MKKLLATSLVMMTFSVSAMADSFVLTTVGPTAASIVSTACSSGGCAPIYNAKPEALNYNGGAISATLREGINALDTIYDTSNLTDAEKIQYIGQGKF